MTDSIEIKEEPIEEFPPLLEKPPAKDKKSRVTNVVLPISETMTDSIEIKMEPPQAFPALLKKPAAKGKKPRAKPNHPPVSVMVLAAIKALHERGGSSLQAIKKYIASNYDFDVKTVYHTMYIRKYLISAVEQGVLIQTKGKGAVGSFKLNKARGKTKPGADKPKAAKPKAVKSKVAKKPAAEEEPNATASPVKNATKKPAAKKPRVKKTAALLFASRLRRRLLSLV